jgi:hypothetical protein
MLPDVREIARRPDENCLASLHVVGCALSVYAKAALRRAGHPRPLKPMDPLSPSLSETELGSDIYKSFQLADQLKSFALSRLARPS